MEPLAFNNELLFRRPPQGIDVDTTLAHFAIITILVKPEIARCHLHARFELDLIEVNGREWALVSVVPFVDQDFRFARFPWFQWQFGQTNYRMYATDTETGEHIAWFFGTSLDSWTVTVPRFFWKLPWDRAHIQFDCTYDAALQRYTTYRMQTTNSWADAKVELSDCKQRPENVAPAGEWQIGIKT